MRLRHAVGLVMIALFLAPVGAQDMLQPPVMGKIIWPEHDLSGGQVLIYSDPELKTLVDQFGTGGEGGTFVLILDPGEYYLMAIVDADGDQGFGEGDGVGFFGITEYGAEGQERQPLKITGKTVVGDVRIPIVAVFKQDDAGKLVFEAIENPEATEATPTGVSAMVTGSVSDADGVAQPIVVMLMASDSRLVADIARVSAEAPAFRLEAPAGNYHLIAMADVSGDGRVGDGDRFGSIDLPDWGAPPESLPTLELEDAEDRADLTIPLTGHVGDDLVIAMAGGEGSFEFDPGLISPVISGRVAYPAAGLKPVQVRISAEPMGQPVAGAECEPGPGTFIAAVSPGAYYLTAVVDENGDGKFGPQDTIGIYGLTDLAAGTAPKAVNVEAGSLVADVEITIVMRINDEGRPEPLPAATEE